MMTKDRGCIPRYISLLACRSRLRLVWVTPRWLSTGDIGQTREFWPFLSPVPSHADSPDIITYSSVIYELSLYAEGE